MRQLSRNWNHLRAARAKVEAQMYHHYLSMTVYWCQDNIWSVLVPGQYTECTSAWTTEYFKFEIWFRLCRKIIKPTTSQPRSKLVLCHTEIFFLDHPPWILLPLCLSKYINSWWMLLNWISLHCSRTFAVVVISWFLTSRRFTKLRLN